MDAWGYTVAAYALSAGLYGGYLAYLLRQRHRADRGRR